VAALCLAIPVLAGPGQKSEEEREAAKVAKKVEKDLGRAHQAEQEREALRGFQEEVAGRRRSPRQATRQARIARTG
jgi:hypothetical protein